MFWVQLISDGHIVLYLLFSPTKTAFSKQREREKNVKAIICCKIIEITDYYKRALEIRLIYIPDKMINYRFLVLLETLIILFSM